MDLIILFATFFILLFIGVPVAFSLGLSSLFAVLYLGLPPMIVLQKIFGGIDVYALMAIPFFIFAGELMLHGGIARRLINFAGALFSPLRGSLGPMTVFSSTLFGGVSGSAVADASALGSILIPEMQKANYGNDYAVNVTASSAITALLIPPSQNMIIYTIAAGGSISLGSLFLAGIIPGVITGLAVFIVACLVAARRGYPRAKFPGGWLLLQTFIASIPALLSALIIVVGIRAGIFTPIESAVIAIIYSLLITLFLYRSLSWKDFLVATKNSARTTGMILFVIATASAFGWILSENQLPQLLFGFLLTFKQHPVVVFLLINVFLLVLGSFMDMSPLIIITTPIFLPIAQKLGMDPVQFGVMLILNLGIGLFTPPVGSLLFVSCALAKTKIEQTLKGAWPFYLALLIALALVTYIPAISLWLPHYFHGH